MIVVQLTPLDRLTAGLARLWKAIRSLISPRCKTCGRSMFGEYGPCARDDCPTPWI